MTDRLYYADSYAMHFEATVIEHTLHEGKPALILNQTYFYPSSGGQPHDKGHIDGIQVIDVAVRDADGVILHILENPFVSTTGASVKGVIDWERRFDHMQQHTGQHILTQAFIQAAGAKTVSFHLSAESVTIDLDANNLSQEQIDSAEKIANGVIQAHKSVVATLRQMNDQEGVRIRKLPKHMLTDGLRVVEIEGFDITACGGTHVAHTGEIGLIKIVKLEKRGDKLRVEFRCGGRALADYAEKHRVLSALATEMNCRYPEIPDNVAKIRAELKMAQTSLKELREQLVEYEAAKLLTEAPNKNGYALITAVFEGRDAGELRLLASRLTAGNGVVALLGTADEKAQMIFARSADLPFNMGALLKDAATQLGGRGGGQPAFAQGGGVTATSAQLNEVILKIAAGL